MVTPTHLRNPENYVVAGRCKCRLFIEHGTQKHSDCTLLEGDRQTGLARLYHPQTITANVKMNTLMKKRDNGMPYAVGRKAAANVTAKHRDTMLSCLWCTSLV